VHVLQGDREFASDNRTLGRFHLDGIPSAPRGMPQVEVSFDIDANGILNVSAKDKGTNKEQSVRIEASSGLSPEEIDKMQQDAETNAEADKARRQGVDKRNEADQLIYSTEKSLKEHGDKLSDEDRQPVEAALEAAKKALEGDDLTGLEAAVTKLQETSHKLAEAVYADVDKAAGQQAAGDGAQTDPTEAQDDGGAVDADFEVVDEDDDSKGKK
jgi:molecular chaperone DnaK